MPSDALNKIYDRIKSVLEVNRYDVTPSKDIPYGIQFTLSLNSWSGVLRIYENKKGAIKVDYSPLRDKAVQIRSLLESDRFPSDDNKTDQDIEDVSFPVIGTDESGKGDYFGPLVCAGVFVTDKTAAELIAIGVKDSKALKDDRNNKLAMAIKDICGDKIAIIEIAPIKYNALYKQFKEEGKNLNTLLAWAHARAIEDLLERVDCRAAVADQFGSEKLIIGKLQKRGKGIKLIQTHRAERNIAVAAASIVARNRFLKRLETLSAEFKIDLLKGASGMVKARAKKFVALHGSDNLGKVAKLHFKTTNDVVQA